MRALGRLLGEQVEYELGLDRAGAAGWPGSGKGCSGLCDAGPTDLDRVGIEFPFGGGFDECELGVGHDSSIPTRCDILSKPTK